MKQQLDILLNILLFLAVVLLFIVLQTSIFNYYFFKSFGPDLCLIMIIYLGVRRNFWEGFIVSFIISYILSINGSGQHMLFFIHYLLIFIMARLVGSAIYMDSYKDHIGAGGILTFMDKFILILWAYIASVPAIWHFIWTGVLSSVINALLAPLLFFFFNWLDILTGRAEPEYVKNRPETVR